MIPLSDHEAKQLIRTAYDVPLDHNEEFYARAFKTMLRPSQVLSTWLQILNGAFYLFVICAIAWLGTQALDRAFPVDIIQTKLLVADVPAGEPIRVRYEVFRLRTCRTTIRWTIVDGDQELHEYGPIIVESGGPPGRDQYVRGFTTSKNLVQGEGKLRVSVSYQCPNNYLQGMFPVVRTLPDVTFTILPQNKFHDQAGSP